MQFKGYVSALFLAMAFSACLAAPLPVATDNIERFNSELQKPEGCLVWDEQLGTCKEWTNKPATTTSSSKHSNNQDLKIQHSSTAKPIATEILIKSHAFVYPSAASATNDCYWLMNGVSTIRDRPSPLRASLKANHPSTSFHALLIGP